MGVQLSQKLPGVNVVNAKELEIKGITNFQQAMLQAYRALNKIKYQKRSVEYGTYDEADLNTRNNIILVADDTRPMLISSGSVLEYEGNISASTYLVTTDTQSKRDLFLTTEKSGGGVESSITAINNTDQYYLNDKDYI